jgi:hypothetical protein
MVLCLVSTGWAQSGRSRPAGGNEKRNQPPAATPTPEPAPVPPSAPTIDSGEQDGDTVKVDTNLVTVPIIASDRDNRYLTDLQQGELEIFEDDKPQQIAFFNSITAPFNVILMLDTSASTDYKLGQIQNAAISFVDQLQTADRVKVMSFDDQIRTLADFTNQRAAIRQGIYSARPGKGTKLYDAVELAINSFRPIQGRKAIVLFTDGVDSYSDQSSYDKNRKALEEAGIIVYPIRYDTRADLEAMIRQQQQGGGTVNLGSILGGGGGDRSTTPSTFPGGTVPSLPPGSGGPTLGNIQLPPIGVRRDDTRDPNNPSQFPPNGRNDPAGGTAQGGTTSTNPVAAELDMLYSTADKYLNDLARTTGGELNRADSLGSLPAVFTRIAAELRTQYSLGYYPANPAHDGRFHKLKVKTTRKGAIIRARPGYRAPAM